MCCVILRENMDYRCLRNKQRGMTNEGNGEEGSGRHGGNDFRNGFKKEWLECENEECKVWVSIRVTEGG